MMMMMMISRMCCRAEHKIHIFVGCTTLAPSEYTNKHNMVLGYIQWTICKHKGLQVTNNYCKHAPECVINVNVTTVMWDIPVIVGHTMLANWPDGVLHEKKRRLAY